MEFNVNTGVHNRFDFVVRDSETGEIKNSAKAENIILNQFWQIFLNSEPFYITRYIHFGSGTAIPQATDTRMTTYIGRKAASMSDDNSEWEASRVLKRIGSIRIEANEHNGKSISEVGFGADSTSVLYTKALITDQNGNPITINKTDSDIVDIYGTFYSHIPAFYENQDIAVDPFNTRTGEAAQFISWANLRDSRPAPAPSLGIGTMESDYNSNQSLTSGTVTYDVDRKEITWNAEQLQAATGNDKAFTMASIAGIRIVVPNENFNQPLLTRELVATGDGITKNFQSKFGNLVKDSGLQVFVNDVPVEASFSYGLPQLSPGYINTFMKPIEGFGYNNRVLENSRWDTYEISKIYTWDYDSYYVRRRYTWAKNNLEDDWVNALADTSNASSSIWRETKAAVRNYRYWSFTSSYSTEYPTPLMISNDLTGSYDLHLAEAPPAGSTVTLTYKPGCIAKTSDYVIKDVSLTATFNEYVPG